eukprot:10784120-Alexandrium_andersonii.AAC.1
MAAAASSSWSVRQPSWVSEASSSEQPSAPDAGFLESGVEDDPEAVSAIEAGEEFGELLIQLKRSGTLSARQACLLAFWASKAGCTGVANTLAFRPGAPTGHYIRHWDAATKSKLDKKGLYHLQVPQYQRCDATRT